MRPMSVRAKAVEVASAGEAAVEQLAPTFADIPLRREAGLTIIGARRGGLWTGLLEFWKHRLLLYVFVWRDVKVRYRQTILGVGWAIVQPFLTIVVFTLVFGRLAKVPSAGVPYPVFFFC